MPRKRPTGPHVKPDGTLSDAVWLYLEEMDRKTETTQTNIGSIVSGQAILAAQQEAAAEQAAIDRQARIDADAAIQAGGGGGSPSNSQVWTGGVSSGASWVTLSQVEVTAGGAGGDYTVTINTSTYINGHLSDEGGGDADFQFNWRVTEQLTGGGTLHTLASGVGGVVYTAPFFIPPIDGGPYNQPAVWSTFFNSLPSGLLPANEAAAVYIRFEIQRASGTNEITAPGLDGATYVTWTA